MWGFLLYLFFPVLVAFLNWATLHDGVHFCVSDFGVFGISSTVDQMGDSDGAQVERDENGESVGVWHVTFWEHWVVDSGLWSVSGSAKSSHTSDAVGENSVKHFYAIFDLTFSVSST